MLIHEICHALGFWHEQSRPDRSQHVRILWENIIPSKRVNFARHSFTSIDSLGVDYDLGSIMHYDLFAFSANGQPTMEVLNSNYRGRVGQRCCLSEKDVEQLNLMYQCPSMFSSGSSSVIIIGTYRCVLRERSGNCPDSIYNNSRSSLHTNR